MNLWNSHQECSLPESILELFHKLHHQVGWDGRNAEIAQCLGNKNKTKKLSGLSGLPRAAGRIVPPNMLTASYLKQILKYLVILEDVSCHAY
jgi:hypothetical protein